ncbi:MAG: NAD(P)H-dependent oxidoreductase subunit E [Alteraurantiacibacter sp. bin_em_oilr2.035]|nr:NAD(P)H-dependent oxidoreductase subunit E [Alteraurantiacibacter sp. bin_em_oilr2.035]
MLIVRMISAGPYVHYAKPNPENSIDRAMLNAIKGSVEKKPIEVEARKRHPLLVNNSGFLKEMAGQQLKSIADIVALHIRKLGPLLPVLHDVQAEFGFIDAAKESEIAQALNLSRAEVHGVVSFYHDFLSAPDPRPEVQICRAEACKARGVEGLMAAGEAAAGKRVRLKTVYCLGLCSAGPVARVGNQLHIRLDADRLTQVIEQS